MRGLRYGGGGGTCIVPRNAGLVGALFSRFIHERGYGVQAGHGGAADVRVRG
jgi:hypothetical protein